MRWIEYTIAIYHMHIISNVANFRQREIPEGAQLVLVIGLRQRYILLH